MAGDGIPNFATAQMGAQAHGSLSGQQCFSCGCWYYGLSHSCLGSTGIAWIPPAPALTVADVEAVVAKALEDHAKKYLAIIEKLADALAGKK